MNANVLQRVSPEAVGIDSREILRYLDGLEACGTEMHGLMIARHGKVCAEGWWHPFAPQIRHGCQSLSKSYITTAIGLLVTEGRLDVEQKVIDLIPEYFPAAPCDNLKKMRVQDLLCMSAGARQLVDTTEADWEKTFFALDFPDEPGSKFWYSGVVTTVLGSIVRAVSGEGIIAYLKPRLFDKIGIDSAVLKWMEHPDGLEYGGGGLFATTEDNLRLGLLYLNGGLWNGERILSEAWVRKATSKQIENDDPAKFGGKISDENSGYGFQIWMSKVPGNYMFWGAHGQMVIMMPKLDMAISITQFVDGPEHVPDALVIDTGDSNITHRVWNLTWDFAARVSADCSQLPENTAASTKLQYRLEHLSLKRPGSGPVLDFGKSLPGSAFHLGENSLSVIPRIYSNDPKYGIRLSHKLPRGIADIRFTSVQPGELAMDFTCAGKAYRYLLGLDGVYRVSRVTFAPDMPDMVLGTGVWTGERRLDITLRFVETCYVTKVRVDFAENVIIFNEYSLFHPTGWIETAVQLEKI